MGMRSNRNKWRGRGPGSQMYLEVKMIIRVVFNPGRKEEDLTF